MKYLLDTMILKEIGREKPQIHVSDWLDAVDDSDLAISVITVREIWRGVHMLKARDPDRAKELSVNVTRIFDAYEGRILAISRSVAMQWAEMLARSHKHVDDTGLAATASVHGLVLVTRNIDDVRGRGVRLLNPFKSPAEIVAPYGLPTQTS